MRKMFLFVLLAMSLYAFPALAGFDTSHHDLRTYAGTGNPQACYHCHGRQSAGVTMGADNAGVVGLLCLGRCHALTGIWTSDPANLQPQEPAYPNVAGTWTAPGANFRVVAFSQSHGPFAGTAGTNRSGVFPYDGASAGTNLECTSCHSVHDDTNAPFIWRRMASTLGATWSAATANGFCVTCHQSYSAVGGLSTGAITAPAGYHPVELLVSTTNAAARTSTASAFGTVRHGRTIAIDGPTVYGAGHNLFDVAAPAPAAMRTAAGVSSWTTGGHMLNTTDNSMSAFSNGTSEMGCYTCHSAHKTTGGGSNNLTVMQMDNTNVGFSPLCMGCHGSASTTWAANQPDNTVGTTAYGHPTGSTSTDNGTAGSYRSSGGTFTFAVNIATTNVWTRGTNGQVLCTSCHDVHGGVAGSMAVRNLGQAATTVICKTCHNGIGLPNLTDGASGEVANSHHRTRVSGVLPTYGTTVTYTPSEEAGRPLTIRAPSWASATVGTGTGPFLGLGNMAGGLDCADCHVFNGTAHNW